MVVQKFVILGFAGSSTGSARVTAKETFVFAFKTAGLATGGATSGAGTGKIEGDGADGTGIDDLVGLGCFECLNLSMNIDLRDSFGVFTATGWHMSTCSLTVG